MADILQASQSSPTQDQPVSPSSAPPPEPVMSPPQDSSVNEKQKEPEQPAVPLMVTTPEPLPPDLKAVEPPAPSETITPSPVPVTEPVPVVPPVVTPVNEPSTAAPAVPVVPPFMPAPATDQPAPTLVDSLIRQTTGVANNPVVVPQSGPPKNKRSAMKGVMLAGILLLLILLPVTVFFISQQNKVTEGPSNAQQGGAYCSGSCVNSLECRDGSGVVIAGSCSNGTVCCNFGAASCQTAGYTCVPNATECRDANGTQKSNSCSSGVCCYIPPPTSTPVPSTSTFPCTPGSADTCQQGSNGNTGYICKCTNQTGTYQFNCSTQDLTKCQTSTGLPDAGVIKTTGCDRAITRDGSGFYNIPSGIASAGYYCPNMTLSNGSTTACSTPNPHLPLQNRSSIKFETGLCGVQQIDVGRQDCYMAIDNKCSSTPNPTTPPNTTVTVAPTTPPGGNTPTHAPNSTPTNTPPTTAAQCKNIHLYKTDGTDITDTLAAGTSGVSPGDTIMIGILGSTNSTKARFRVNGGAWVETATKNTTGQFVVQFGLPQITSTQAFQIESEVFGNGAWQ